MAFSKIRECQLCGNQFVADNPAKFHCSLECRFWSKVSVRGPNKCWLWLAGGAGGYGVFKIAGEYVKAHRVAFELIKGPLKNLCLHTCDNPPCCNPGHLWDGTNADNMADRDKKGRQARGSGNGNAKLTKAEVSAIRADTRSEKRIAADFDVSSSLVNYIRQRKLWRHI